MIIIFGKSDATVGFFFYCTEAIIRSLFFLGEI